MIESHEFRRVLGHFASGVTIVTGRLPDGRATGLTVSAFSSVSLVPPLVLICVEAGTRLEQGILEADRFVVNVLEAEAELTSRRFSDPRLTENFEALAYRPSAFGIPILDDALAWLECGVVDTIRAGDHWVFIGEVLAAEAREGAPLLYYRGGYGRFGA
jgi:flavin reductase (DIM6/NTAB) family NADH-FMN oxidoreductase RutF